MKLRIYAIAVTLVLTAVLTNPSAEHHYTKLRQCYPWIDKSLLLDAKMKLWLLTPPSDQEGTTPYDDYDSPKDVPPILVYESWGVFSLVHRVEAETYCVTHLGPELPISVGFLGCVFATRPSKVPYERENAAKQGQAKPFAASLGAQRIVNLKPAEASTNSFGIKGPMMIDMPPRPKDALYKLGPLE